MTKYECGPCGYVYDPEIGDPENKILSPQTIMDYRVGEKCLCTNEMIATIIAYRSSHDIDFQFDEGKVVHNS